MAVASRCDILMPW